MKAYDINWDTDGENIDLPTKIILPDGMEDDEITEYLSDQTGYCVFDYKTGEFSSIDVKNIITDYVNELLRQHDMSLSRNDRNQKIANKIITRCMYDIYPIVNEFKLKQQIRYFVRQTMLYMIDSPN